MRNLGNDLIRAGKIETTDHPPIYPTEAASPDKVKGEKWKLYELIVRRFFATVAPSARSEGIDVTVAVEGELFDSKGYRILFDGWRKYYPYWRVTEVLLPAMTPGTEVDVVGVGVETKETQPPRRYSQGTLLQEMEKLGLGTKSTRHDIIQKLYDRIVRVMRHVGLSYEMIFVNDGSRDNTGNVLESIALADERVTFVDLRRNFGQTTALQAGFDHARGEVIIAMDGDLQHDPNEIPAFLEKLEEGYDVVCGWRKERIDNFVIYRHPCNDTDPSGNNIESKYPSATTCIRCDRRWSDRFYPCAKHDF